MAIGTSDGQQFPDSISFELAQLKPSTDSMNMDKWNDGGWNDSWESMSAFGEKGKYKYQNKDDLVKDMNPKGELEQIETPFGDGTGIWFRHPKPQPAGKGQQEDLVSDNSDVHIIRHGSTDYNSDEKVRSWSNVPLNDEGRQESKEVSKKLADSGIQVLFHSDLDRAADTAKDISKTTKAELVSMPDFRSWNAGELTGKKYSEANPMMMDHAHNKPDEPLPGGESFNEFKERVFAGLDKAEQYANGRQSGIVTHRGVERLLNAWDHHGQPETGEVHLPTFFDEGQDTGSVQKMKLFGTGPMPGMTNEDINATKEAQQPNYNFFSRLINDKAFQDAVEHMPESKNVQFRGGDTNLGKQDSDLDRVVDDFKNTLLRIPDDARNKILKTIKPVTRGK